MAIIELLKRKGLKRTNFIINLLTGTIFALLAEFLHYLILKEHMLNDMSLIIGLYLTGIFASYLIVFITIAMKKVTFFKPNYLLSVYVYYLSYPILLALIIYSFFSDEMNRHLFWFYPGILSSSSYIYYKHKMK